MQRQSGFTLIELVMVIVIIGILAAIAVPKFIDLSAEANSAALQSVVGAIESASAINFAARKASAGAKGTVTAGVACNTAVASLMQNGTLPNGYTVSTAALAATDGTDNTCTVTQTSTTNTATAHVISAT